MIQHPFAFSELRCARIDRPSHHGFACSYRFSSCPSLRSDDDIQHHQPMVEQCFSSRTEKINERVFAKYHTPDDNSIFALPSE